jgi:hypothetical protein
MLPLPLAASAEIFRSAFYTRAVTFEHKTGLKNELTATYKVTLDEKGTIMTGTWHLSAPESKNGKFQARKH